MRSYTAAHDGGELLDGLFRCLQYDARRQVLLSLVGRPPQEPLLVPRDVGGDERAGHDVALHHKHLPVLEEAGLVRWKRDAGEVYPGPQFDRVEDVLVAIRGTVPER